MATELTRVARASRRRFLKSAGSATALALTIGFEWAGPVRRALAATTTSATGAAHGPFEPNAFLRIGADDSVTVIAKHVEMGQGAYTGIATIVAEELDADWARIRVESAPADAKRYAKLSYDEVLARDLQVMDTAAFALARDSDLPLRVFDMSQPGTLLRILRGEDIGTLVQGRAAQ